MAMAIYAFLVLRAAADSALLLNQVLLIYVYMAFIDYIKVT
jgi:hypothetical protein